MADPRPDPDDEDDSGARLDHGSTTGRLRWGRVLGIVIGIALLALFIVLHLTGTLGPELNR
jgi:hypothetical protein